MRKPGQPPDRTKPRRNGDGTSPAAPRPERRRTKPARPHLNLRGTLDDALPMQRPLEPLMAPKDVARFFNTSVSSVRRLVAEGSLRPVRIAGKRALRFKRDHVESLVTTDPKRRKPSGSDPNSGGSVPPTP